MGGFRHVRLLSSVTLSDGASPDLSADVLDAGEATSLDVVITVVEAGDAESDAILALKHAAVNEEGAYLDFDTPVEVSVNVAGRSWFHVSQLTRWVTWSLSGARTGGAVVTVDIIVRG